MTRYKVPFISTLVGANVILVSGFWVLVPHTLPDWQAILVQSARCALSLMVVVTYGMAIMQTWGEEQRQGIRKAPDSTNFLVVGIFLAFLADAFASGQAIVWRWYGKPIEWTESSAWVFAPYITAVAAIHHVLGPGSVDGKIPKRNMILAGVGVALSCLVAGVVLGFRLNGRV